MSLIRGILNIFGISSKLFPAFVKGNVKIIDINGMGSTRLTSNPLTTGRLNLVNSTTISVSGGKGVIIDNYTDPENPVITEISWPTTTIALTRIAESEFTIITINKNLQFTQRLATEQYDYHNYRDEILLGTVQHFDFVNAISVTRRTFIPSIDPALWLAEYQRNIGSVIIDNAVAGNAGGLTLQKSAGKLWGMGNNYFTDPKKGSTILLNALNPITFTYTWRSGSGTWKTYTSQTGIQPARYDDNTTGSPSTRPNGVVANNKWSIQRAKLAGNNVIIIEFGQAVYASLAEAIDGISTEKFTENPSFANYTFYFYLMVRGGAADLSLVTDCAITMSPNVRNGGGSSVTITTLQQAYNNGAEPEIYLNATRGAFSIADATTPIGTSLFEVEANNLTTKYFTVSSSNSKVFNKLAVSTSTRGTSTLVAGTVTVSNTNVATGDLILMSATNQSGTAGQLSYSIVNGTSFTITSTSNTDTRTIHWMIIGQ